MEQFKGTSGEWEVVEHSWSDTSIYCGNKVICTNSIYEEATEETQDELENEVSANFKLMAASKDLLKACQAFMELFNNSDMRPEDESYEVAGVIEDAINKALGL